jgi:predicted acylesterase/phospholipase RssA
MQASLVPEADRIPLQVVFQGGGAKLCVLMAVSEVLKTDSRIQITRAAGSSAGAIAATMLASKKAIETHKAELKDIALKYIETLHTWKRQGVYRVYAGKPYFNKLSLEDFFRDLFTMNTGPQYVRDLLPVEVKLYFTDLYSLRSREASPDDALPMALAKSCRFPLAFIGHASGNTEVDGGLALNLPVDNLKNDESTKGSVIGISFSNNFSRVGKGGLRSYTEQLFSAAIQSGVYRSEAILGKENIFHIETDIGTFDFDRAFTEGLGSHYDHVRLQFTTWFENWLKLYAPIKPAIPAYAPRLVRPPLSNIHLNRAIIRELEARLRAEPSTHAKSVEHYEMALFDDRGQFTHKYQCRTVMVFTVLRITNILEFDFQIGRDAPFTGANLGCAAVNNRGQSLKFIPDVQEISKEGSNLRTFRVYFLFEQPLEPKDPDQPYAVEYQYDAADPYPNLGVSLEYAAVYRRQGDAEKIVLGVALPREKFGGRSAKTSEIATASPDRLREAGYELDAGETFTPSDEVDPHDLITDMDPALPPEEYVFPGRRAQSVRRGQTMGFLIE